MHHNRCAMIIIVRTKRIGFRYGMVRWHKVGSGKIEFDMHADWDNAYSSAMSEQSQQHASYLCYHRDGLGDRPIKQPCSPQFDHGRVSSNILLGPRTAWCLRLAMPLILLTNHSSSNLSMTNILWKTPRKSLIQESAIEWQIFARSSRFGKNFQVP